MRSSLLIALFALVIFHPLCAQPTPTDCSIDSIDLPPLVDLVGASFQNCPGGLYPHASNVHPATHQADGITIANRIKPLNTLGQPDVNGDILMICIGMSLTYGPFLEFKDSAHALPGINPKLKMVNAAIGGKHIDSLLNPASAYFPTAQNMLADSGNTFEQVQIIWFKQVMLPNSLGFPDYPLQVKGKFKSAVRLLKNKFPNLKQVYLTDLRYCANSTEPSAQEPNCWAHQWAVKWLIEDQINGLPGLAYSGPNAPAPWIAWGPSIWADGESPRDLDGLTWVCPDDYSGDGIHYMPPGKTKHAQMLFDFFSTDPTAAPWFYAPVAPLPKTNLVPGPNMQLFPNPSQGKIQVILETPKADKGHLRLIDLHGKMVHQQALGILVPGSNPFEVTPELSPGIYFAVVEIGEWTGRKKIVVSR